MEFINRQNRLDKKKVGVSCSMRSIVFAAAVFVQLVAIVYSQSCTTLRFTNETGSGSLSCAVGNIQIGSRCVELTEVFANLPGLCLHDLFFWGKSIIKFFRKGLHN